MWSRQRHRFSLILALALVLLISVLSLREWMSSRDSAVQIDEARRVLDLNSALLSLMKDAETGQRGFLLTGGEEYLKPYEAAVAGAPRALANLNGVARSSPALATRLDALRTAIRGKLDELRETVDLRRQVGYQAAMNVVGTDRGERAMADIRRLAGEIEQQEYARLVDRSHMLEQSSQSRHAIIAIASGALFLLLMLATIDISRTGSERDRVLAELDKTVRRTSRERDFYETTLASIGEAVVAADASSRITFLNGPAESLTKWTRAEATGKPLEEVLRLMPADGGSGAGGQDESILIARDASRVAVEDTVAPVRDDQHREIGAVHALRDISERRRAEKALRESEERFRLAVDAGQVGIWDWDVLADRINWSDRVYEIHRIPRGGFDGTVAAFTRLIHPDDADLMSRTIQAALADDTPYAPEFRIVRPNGEVRWIYASAQVIRDPAGRAVRMLGAIIDVTPRREMENDLRLTADRFRIGLTNSRVIVFNQDRDLRYTWLSTAGILPEASPVLGRTDFELEPSPEMAKLMDVKRQVIDNCKPARIEAAATLAGQMRMFDISMEPQFDASGVVVGILGAAIDVTETRSTERYLRDLNSALERTNSDLQQFSYAASHDLKEPLRTISTYVQLLRRRYRDRPLDAEAAEMMEYVVRGAGRMAQLLDALLDYSRAGIAGVAPALVETTEVFHEVMDSLRLSIDETRAAITFDPLPKVVVDQTHLRQIFQNLLANALKYRSSDTPRVHAAAADGGAEWIFSIHDNGIGIDPEFHRKIFGVFARLNGDRYEGAGIGLATCKKLAELYGGRIWVESEAGKGSTFLFTLPKAVPTIPPIQTEPRP